MKPKNAVKKDTDKDFKFPKWQTGEYFRGLELNYILPQQFLFMCKLADVTPRTVIMDFLDNLACSSWKRQGRDKAKQYLVEYFLAMGYGQQVYTPEDIRQMFKELDSIGLLWPDTDKRSLIDLHVKWREKYGKFWFKNWFRKHRRKLTVKHVE